MIDFRFYLITDRGFCAPRHLTDVVAEAVAAGVRAVQLREKDLGRAELDALIERLHTITGARGAHLLVNAGCRTAPLPAGVGRHFPDGTRIETRPGAMAAASTHSLHGVMSAAEAGVDFVTFGPVFQTLSKTSLLPAQGLDELARVAEAAPVPVFALGGVTAHTARACVEAGAAGVAAIGAVMGEADTRAAVERMGDALGGL